MSTQPRPVNKSADRGRGPRDTVAYRTLSGEQSGSSLARGLQILDLVVERGQIRVSAIAAMTGLPVSTVYRYVRQLRDAGYLVEVDGFYGIGARFNSGPSRRQVGHLVQMAAPILRRLTEVTREASILTVRVKTSALCLDRVMPARRYLLSFHRGTVRPLHAAASALVLLAYAPDEVIREVLAGPLPQFTANTPTRGSLMQQLAHIRDQGFVVSYGEVDADKRAVAAPAFRGNECVCGISVAGPATRIGDDQLDATVEAVIAAAEELSHGLDSVEGAVAWIVGGPA